MKGVGNKSPRSPGGLMTEEKRIVGENLIASVPEKTRVSLERLDRKDKEKSMTQVSGSNVRLSSDSPVVANHVLIRNELLRQ